MKKIQEIINILKESGLDSMDFLTSRNRPTVQKNGDRYEILSITYDEDENTLEISGIKVWPSYEYALNYLTVDSTWREKSLNHIKDIVQKEIDRYIEMLG